MSGVELAQQFFDAANARDWDAIASIHTADHEYHDPQGPKPEPGGRAMAGHLAFYVEALEGHWTVQQIVDAGEHVTVRWTGSGRHGNDLIGVPATGGSLGPSLNPIFISRFATRPPPRCSTRTITS